MDTIFIELNLDKEPYIKRITDDKVINLTGESGSGKSYFSKKWFNNSDYIVIDTDIVFSDKKSNNMESVELRKIFIDKQKDYLFSHFDDFYLKTLDYFKNRNKTIVIDSAQFRNMKNILLLKGQVIVLRTSIHTCYVRSINRFKENNANYTDEELEKYSNKKKGMYKWYKSLNAFIKKIDTLRS